ncbi:MAG: CGGC domain-containing protein [Planctomycetes bacterium]|nr:CGGC domain-containing protein [Planctomycetota bacterium]
MPADVTNKKQVVVIQCDGAVHEVCGGFMCEHDFNARLDAFRGYPEGTRYMSISCGGCPGRATLRKLKNITKNLKKREQREPGDVMVHLSTCITRSSTHGPRCPHIDYIKGQIERAGYDYVEDSRISPIASKRRAEGMYQ